MFHKAFRNTNQKIKKLQAKLKLPVFRRLSTRLLFILTMLSALPLIIVGLFMTSVTQQSLSEFIQSQYSELVRRVKNEIILFIETNTKPLEILIETKDISDMNPFTQSLILNKVKSTYPVFERIFTIDTLGNEITTSAFDQHTLNYSNEEFFLRAISDTNFLSPVRFSSSKEPFVISAHPIRRFDKVVGVLAGEIDLKTIWQLVDSVKIGKTGNVFVINNLGRLIAHPDKKKVYDQAKVIDLDIIGNLESKSEKSDIFYSPEGIRMLGTFAYLEEFDWIIVIQQPFDEAYAVIQRMRYQVFIFVGFVILVAILFAFLLEERITAPIKTLVDGVKKYAEGKLDFRLHVDKYEEIAVLNDEFNSMAERLLENQRKLRKIERSAAMSRFATLVSHEIRNPLNSMNINMRILKNEMENPEGDLEKKRKYFNIIISEIDRMNNLINNFLMISRPPHFNFLPNDLHGILEEVILMHAGKAEQQRVSVVKEFNARKLLTGVDRDQMKQVFHNIIINGLQAMPNGGSLTIKTSLRKRKARKGKGRNLFCIEIIDTGIGISEEKIKDIFEYYYTSKKTGTGLGLAIARQIVESHNGTIAVKSKTGQGTQMTVNIPVSPEPVAQIKEHMPETG